MQVVANAYKLIYNTWPSLAHSAAQHINQWRKQNGDFAASREKQPQRIQHVIFETCQVMNFKQTDGGRSSNAVAWKYTNGKPPWKLRSIHHVIPASFSLLLFQRWLSAAISKIRVLSLKQHTRNRAKIKLSSHKTLKSCTNQSNNTKPAASILFNTAFISYMP